ncbi:SGNH/GDSL hydrolase family protein [Psychroserpens sp. Hel_I_66]|uniref:SGNH/GDSL hydrolase family protein n=1 Tax=Psychroserpens sp. Hel_I_66 TaxID=1250004 RepID=UPI00068B785A|nr:SGNH/GDSL hydrolase family protein [Psychroserpens sp. Hel_I_66]
MKKLIIIIFILLFHGLLICQENSDIEKQLSPMNKVEMAAFKDTINTNDGKLFKILVIGNSITNHGISETIGWTHESGMAASNIRNDYVHIILKKTTDLMPERKVSMRIAGGASFERNFDTFNYKKMDSLKGYKPDVIIFQLGENVSFDSIKTPILFEQKYIKLINYVKANNKPIVVCTTPFFPSLEKNKVINNVALKTNSFIADLSHLVLLEKENYSKNELDYPGDKSKWKSGGIGIHPGDYGMENIALQIMVIIKAALEL